MFEINKEKADRIAAYFDEIDRQSLNLTRMGIPTKKGLFFPTQIRYISPCIEQLVDANFISTSEPCLDSGCGDGRILVLTNGKYNMPSFGIEYDTQICQRARERIARSNQLGLLGDAAISVSEGEFESDEPYARLNLRFSDIGTIFNFWNNAQLMAAKIANQSNIGAVFLLESPDERHPEYNGINYYKTLIVNPSGIWGKFLHVYKKSKPLYS